MSEREVFQVQTEKLSDRINRAEENRRSENCFPLPL